MSTDNSKPPRGIDRRQSLAAIGVAWTATGAAAQPTGSAALPNLTTGPLNPASFGAPLDGRNPDQVGIQRAMDTLAAATPPGGTVRVDRGRVHITEALVMRPDIDLDFGRASVVLQPTSGYAIGVGWAPDSSPVGVSTIRGRSLELRGANQTAIAIRNGSVTQILATDIALRSPRQTGIKIVATDRPNGPYYGLIDNIRINGNGSDGQFGIVLDQKRGLGALGVNRWSFSNVRHLASLAVGLDVRGAHGLVFNNIHFESCSSRAARFGFDCRRVRGTVSSKQGGNGGFQSNDLKLPDFDPVGAFRVLSGPNAGESMVAKVLDLRTGAVVFPAAFPYEFEVGDQFEFIECECNSISMLNVTNEGGSSDDEVGFEFLAGARDCRVHLAMTTMARGAYFRREIEDESNSIARASETLSYSGTVTPGAQIVWLPNDGQPAGRGGSVNRGTAWIDALYITGASGSGGTISAQVFANGQEQGLTAKLTPASPYFGRRIRKELRPNGLLSPNQHIKVRLEVSGVVRPEEVRVDIVIAYY